MTLEGGAMRPRRGAIFFDRDGTLNEDFGYVFKAADLHWRTGAIEAIRLVNEAGYLAIVITNQSGVARGFYSEADVDAFHIRMQEELAASGAWIDAFYVCPFHHEAVVDAYRHADHPDRKPNPGMILRAMRDWSIDVAKSAMIGDLESDVRAGEQAGLHALLCGDGNLTHIVHQAFEMVGVRK